MTTSPDPAPEPDRPRARRPRRAVRRGTETSAVAGLSEDERPGGWGDAAPSPESRGADDERLLRDVPPHYGRH
ncbi:hypothetical protein [Cellulosimicrobium marinum]|uniref:hypothetical protein n=1 Tax=Cellulosimicrobium marinum TaxID=1638992 RepID=UPI001E5073C7|nr:hypothetical protein [Cellulosimicrobium marinum]MCB7136975.1 hypothetical protein [Cellulosimicrobium marinum]